MKFEQITCDGCGRDLTTRSNSVDYRLVLTSEMKPGYGAGAYTDMMIYPPIDRTHHFCRLDCLDLWRDREKLYTKLRHEKSEKWVEEHGTKHEYGRSYPCPPKDILETWESESKAAALKAFPIVNN